MKELLQQDLELKTKMLIQHFDTLLRRTQLFLPIETALLYIAVKEVTSKEQAGLICGVAIVTAILWYLFAARDYLVSFSFQKVIKESREQRILEMGPHAPGAPYELPPGFEYPTQTVSTGFWETLFVILQPKGFGVRWMGVLLPFLTFWLWVVVWVIFLFEPFGFQLLSPVCGRAVGCPTD